MHANKDVYIYSVRKSQTDRNNDDWDKPRETLNIKGKEGRIVESWIGGSLLYWNCVQYFDIRFLMNLHVFECHDSEQDLNVFGKCLSMLSGVCMHVTKLLLALYLKNTEFHQTSYIGAD